MERRFFLSVWGILALATVCAAQPGDVHLNCTAVSERGDLLAKGTFCIVQKAEEFDQWSNSTAGSSQEPSPMYMLFSYVLIPTGGYLMFPQKAEEACTQRVAWSEWKGESRTVLDAKERVSVPAGTFEEVLKYRTTFADVHSDSEKAARFIDGVRYLWFAKGVGLVRMRYEHSNGIVTEAVLLSHKLGGPSDAEMPLQVGNRWTYAWKNDYRDEAVIETWVMGDKPQDLKEDSTPRSETQVATAAKAGADSNSVRLDASCDSLVRIAPSPERGFQFPYYLFVPKGPAAGHMLVEMNNTGTTSDDLAVHDERAEHLVRDSYANQMARKLQTPLLVPVFPRPSEQWQAYTHSLDEDTLKIVSGPLARIDLQLIAMIRDTQALLRRNGVEVRDRVFMHGYSASGVFTNRFAILHPDVVRAVAAGGVNGIPTFATRQWQGTRLAFPVGVADIKELTGSDFNEPAYKRVSQYIYMGYLDRNDTTLSRDAFCEEHAQLIRSLIGADMGKRWLVSQSIYRELGVPAQCVTYNGSGHEIKPEMIDDVVAFFKANSGDGFVPIEPHEYPFVEYREIKTAHVNGVYWQGDERIPEWCRDLFEGRGHFIIAIDEWMEGQDHRQLDAFRENAGFEFLLKAAGRDDVRIASGNSVGTCSGGHGDFQGFVVGLKPSELDQVARGVEYTLTPVEPRAGYTWQVQDGVRLVRP
jgi:hypothetical protein